MCAFYMYKPIIFFGCIFLLCGNRLPRVIICGQTEDQLPKVVIADSERKGREKCFEKLTGKLTESLTMQEKLVQENAQLEGGKYARFSYTVNFK